MDTTMKLRDLLEHLEEITKCAVCLESVGSDVVQCMTGHGICARCRRQILMCPICNEFFLCSRPIMLAQILETLPKLCKFSEQGCKNISFSSNHERFCEFRTIKCVIAKSLVDCQWVGTVKDFKAHVQRDHNSFFCSYVSGAPKNLFYNHFKDPWHTRFYVHVVENNLFFLYAHKDQLNKRFIQLVKHIPIGPPQDTFYFVLTFAQDNIIYKHTMKVFAISSDNERLDNNPFCMITPLEELELLVNKDSGSLKVTFEAIKK